MTKGDVEHVLAQIGVRSRELGSDYRRDCQFVAGLYGTEEKPIFEHSGFHVLSHLRFGSVVWGIEGGEGKWKGVAVLREGRVFLFTPAIENHKMFTRFLGGFQAKLGVPELEIQNVSKQWTALFEKHTVNFFPPSWRYSLHPRSKEEVVYDAKLLHELRGKEFEKLRNSKNKLLKRGTLAFRAVRRENLSDALHVLEAWQEEQGYKYAKNRYAKEQYTVERFCELAEQFPDILFEIGYGEGKPLSMCILHRTEQAKQWGVIYLVRGLNRRVEGGMHGVSDATYCHCFDRAYEWGIKFLNDGELGSEYGTREHKLRFKPVEFLQSFDIVVQF